MSKKVATFVYEDETGTVVYCKHRYECIENGQKRKSFSFEHTKQDDKWHKGRFYKPVLYNLPALIEFDTVYFVEGERKADLLNSWGLTATCLDSGARSKWYAEYNEFLKDKTIIILPDNDEPGREYALKIANNLNGIAKEIKIVELPGLKESEDIVDWASWEKEEKEGNTKEKFLEIVKNTPVSQLHDHMGEGETGNLKLTPIAEVLDYPEPEYLICGLIEINTLNILTAEAGVGKTLFTFFMAKSLVTGEKFLGQFEIKKKCRVLIVDQENSKPHLRERMEGMGFTKDMPVSFLHFQGVKLDNPDISGELMATIGLFKPDFIIFDALIRLHSSDENSNSEMSKVMGQLREIVGKTDATVLLIHHDRKNTGGSTKLKARGASDIIGAVDCHLSLEKQKDGTLILSPGKTRSISFEPIVLKFDPDSFCFEMLGIGNEGVKKHKNEEILGMTKTVMGEQKMSFKEIRERLKEEKYKVGNNRLREILNDGRCFSKTIRSHGVALYGVKSSFPDDEKPDREAETHDNKGEEGSFPASEGVYGTENREAGNNHKSKDSPKSDNFENADESDSELLKPEVII